MPNPSLSEKPPETAAPGEKYQVALHPGEPGETGWWAEVLGLPGCCAQGDTLAELEVNLAYAIADWLAAGGRPEPRAITSIQTQPEPPPCIYYFRQRLLLPQTG